MRETLTQARQAREEREAREAMLLTLPLTTTPNPIPNPNPNPTPNPTPSPTPWPGGCVLLSGARGVGKSVQLLDALYRRKHEEKEPGARFVGAAMRARAGEGAAAALQSCVEGAL